MMSYMTAERSGMKYVSLLSSENIFKCWGILGGRPHTKTALNVQDVPDGNSWKSVYLLAALSLCWLLPVATNCSTSLQSLHSLGWGLSANQATSAQLRWSSSAAAQEAQLKCSSAHLCWCLGAPRTSPCPCTIEHFNRFQFVQKFQAVDGSLILSAVGEKVKWEMEK